MKSSIVKKFPLYDWWYLPETAGLTDPRDLIRTMLEARGFIDSKKGYHSPFLMGGMEAAVERIISAKEKNEKVLIHGDYDVDGIVGVVLLYRFLKSAGMDPLIFLPTRQDNGYGLALEAVEKAIINGISLMVTVDCGISDRENVRIGVENGIDFIITDHHKVPDELPDAVAIVHADIEGEDYPFPSLSGAAVAYKLVQALSERMKVPIEENSYLPYVGLSTITDIMPLVGENRQFVRDGIAAIQNGFAPHLELLARAAGFKLEQIGARVLGIHIGSRLNAPGRLKSPVASAKFLMEENQSKMVKLAMKIEQMNVKRREIQENLAYKAVEMAKREKGNPVYVLNDADWHEGLLGTAASRVVDATGCPAILFTKGKDGMWKGSGRSLNGIDLHKLLCECHETMHHFGGHPAACGVTVEAEKFNDFKQQLIEHANAVYPDGFDTEKLDITSKLSIWNVDTKFINELKVLEPYGNGNPEPLFEIGPVAIENASFVGGGNHMKMQ
ncbi:single-stranded-DNA-specific exonuclease RecJ, partial [bacterium]|nr:single-stranded-DNA-specific exonuclease RecJ [bacterium]MBU1024770.1 single-stranded-DNA-specific exonuclease RecJ [bacterium]